MWNRNAVESPDSAQPKPPQAGSRSSVPLRDCAAARKVLVPAGPAATLGEETGVPGGVSTCQSAGNCTAPILNVPKDTGSFSVIYSTPLFKDYQLTARIADVFVGSSYDEAFYFGIKLPSYNISNARLTLSTDRWSANLFVDNLANKVALLTANNTSFQLNIPSLVRYSTNQPRTFGTQINYRF